MRISRSLSIGLAFMLVLVVASSAAPVGTAFTYQGRLEDGGAPANGIYDLEFALYDAASAGSQVGSTVTKEDVAVANGLFVVALDFGSGAFTGDAPWLQIGVRRGSSSDPFTPLASRQELTPTPYAVYATKALETDPKVAINSANYVSKWSGSALVQSSIVDNGNVGIGVTNPASKLDVGGAVAIMGTTVIDAAGKWVGPSPCGAFTCTTVTQNYTNLGSYNLTCPSGYMAIAGADSGHTVVLNAETPPPPPPGSYWACYLTPNANAATGLHCEVSTPGAWGQFHLRCCRVSPN